MTGATSASSNNELRLSDGRIVGYGEWGAPAGPLVLGFHGGGLSRLAHYGDEAPQRTGIRLVMPDRPGFGRSDPDPDGTLLDLARDAAQLATKLGAERFAVLGASAGGPGALACGYLLSERVIAVGVACGVGPARDEPELLSYLPPHRQELVELARVDLGAARAQVAADAAEHVAAVAADAEALVDEFPPGTPDSDREVMADPAVRSRFLAALRESAARGPDAIVQETLRNYVLPWGFDLREIRVPVHIWHGREDMIVPPEAATLIARRIEGATLRLFAGEGHCVDYLHVDEILTTLAAALNGR